jgi:deazaflavin-dependent oxidoreductase (nitroreductase family)
MMSTYVYGPSTASGSCFPRQMPAAPSSQDRRSFLELPDGKRQVGHGVDEMVDRHRHRLLRNWASPEEVTVMKTLAKLIAGVLVAVAAVGVAFVGGMRTKSPIVVNTVRRWSRAMRPYVLKSAGTPGAYASVVRHVGRTSGQPYETPITAVSTDDGFVIALPYGSEADWVKNVLAAGTAILVHEGTTYTIVKPQIVPLADVVEAFSSNDQRAHRLFGVESAFKAACSG